MLNHGDTEKTVKSLTLKNYDVYDSHGQIIAYH